MLWLPLDPPRATRPRGPSRRDLGRACARRSARGHFVLSVFRALGRDRKVRTVLVSITDLARRYEAMCADDDAMAAQGVPGDSLDRAALDSAILSLGYEIAVRVGVITRADVVAVEGGAFLVTSDRPDPAQLAAVQAMYPDLLA